VIVCAACHRIQFSVKLGSTYELETPTLAILTDNEERRIPVTIPANAIVVPQQVDGPMVDVKWDGMIVTMFVIDLSRRGQIVDTDAETPAPPLPHIARG
jgi:hypothetical protein